MIDAPHPSLRACMLLIVENLDAFLFFLISCSKSRSLLFSITSYRIFNYKMGSLLVDKHRPRSLDHLDYHPELSSRLRALVS